MSFGNTINSTVNKRCFSLPSHVCPSPLNPLLQLQLNPLGKSTQSAFLWQLWVCSLHSSAPAWKWRSLQLNVKFNEITTIRRDSSFTFSKANRNLRCWFAFVDSRITWQNSLVGWTRTRKRLHILLWPVVWELRPGNRIEGEYHLLTMREAHLISPKWDL